MESIELNKKIFIAKDNLDIVNGYIDQVKNIIKTINNSKSLEEYNDYLNMYIDTKNIIDLYLSKLLGEKDI